MRSLIQTINQNQTLEENQIIEPGTVTRRFGCNCRLVGNAIELIGDGYYTVTAVATVEPTATGIVTVSLYDNGVPVSGARASVTASAVGDAVTLPIVATIRQRGIGDSLTLVLTANAGEVTNVAIRVEKA